MLNHLELVMFEFGVTVANTANGTSDAIQDRGKLHDVLQQVARGALSLPATDSEIVAELKQVRSATGDIKDDSGQFFRNHRPSDPELATLVLQSWRFDEL